MTESKTIIITGTSKGIGRYLSELYLDKGYTVIGCSRGKTDLKKSNYYHFELDISNEEDVLKMFKDIRNLIVGNCYLINNAGIASMNHSLTTPGKTVTKIFNTNVLGTFLFCRESAKIMSKQRFGRIVNFATVATPLSLEGESIYASSKAAIISLTKTLSKELAVFGITVNAIGPTPIDTNLIKNVPKDKIDKIISRQSIKRKGEFRDVSNVIDFFFMDESDYINGQTIFLGGVF